MSLPSRKLRYSNRKKSRLGTFITLGLTLFGSIFIVFIVYELILAQSGGRETGLQAVTSSTTTIKQDPKEKETSSSAPEIASSNAPELQPESSPVPQAPEAKPAVAAPKPQSSPLKSTTPSDVQQQAPAQQQTPVTQEQPKPAPATTNVKKTDEGKNERKTVKHVVQKGETLIKLSRKYYGNQRSINKIAAYNGLNPDRALLIGKVLYIPVPD